MIPITERIGVRKIQRGTVRISDRTLEISLSGFRNVSRMIALMHGQAGYYTNKDGSVSKTSMPYVSDLTKDKLTIACSYSSYGTYEDTVSYQVIEFY